MDINEILEFIVSNYGWIMFIMVALISIILECVKVPLKKLTSKISHDKVRKLVNKTFIILAFLISFGLYYAGSKVLPKYVSYDPLQCLIAGAFSNVLYALAEGMITTSKSKILVDAIQDVTADGKIDEKEVIQAIKEEKKKESKKKASEKEKTALEKWQEEMKK